MLLSHRESQPRSSSLLHYLQSKITWLYHCLKKTNDSELGLYFIEEHSDGLREYSTIVYDIPKKTNVFSGIEASSIDKGEPYHNSSDISRRYVFNKIRRLHVVALGKSENSQFDFSVSISVLSAKTWDALVMAAWIIVGGILSATFVYVVIKELVIALRKRSHA